MLSTRRKRMLSMASPNRFVGRAPRPQKAQGEIGQNRLLTATKATKGCPYHPKKNKKYLD